MQIVQKPNGGVRLVTNYKYINQWVKRPDMPDLTVTEECQRIKPESKVFASQPATILPSGLYVYLNPPMGLSCSGDFYGQCASLVSARRARCQSHG